VESIPPISGKIDSPHGLSEPKKILKIEALEQVRRLMESSRGQELRGTFNPLLIGDLFWEHSKRWEKLATGHLNQVYASCQDFLKLIVPNIANGNDEVSAALFKYHINGTMVGRLAEAQKELQRIFADRRRYPITYNHYFIDIMQKVREEDLRAEFQEVSSQGGFSNSRDPTYSMLPRIIKAFAEKIEVDMEKYASEQILNNMLAYYKVCSFPTISRLHH
jgi:hypothetical protein